MKRAPRAGGWIAIAAACGLAIAATPAGAQGQALEYSLKAAFLTKFGAFAAWPTGALGPSDPLTICVVGEDPFPGTLDQTVSSASAGFHRLRLRRLSLAEPGSGCHILYAAGSSRQSVGEALAQVRGAPVLTVTDAAKGPTRGIIHFVIFEDRVRFHIDQGQATRNGLSISSKLLALALSVKR